MASLLNHSGRPIGSQLDGTFLCILGGALGIAISCFALEMGSITETARGANGGVAAAVLIPGIAIVSWIRCSMLRFYQAMMTTGMAIIFMCLVKTDVIGKQGDWDRGAIWSFSIPWLLGLGVCQLINLVIFPEGGSKALTYETRSTVSPF